MLQGLESLLGSLGLVVGVTYVIGGLIVNLNLSQYGVTEYQIVRVKYLAVGMTFLINAVWNLMPGALAAFALLIWLPSPWWWVIAIFSLLAGVWLLWFWARPRTSAAGVKVLGWQLGCWRFWVIVTAAAWVYPLMVMIRQWIAPQSDVFSVLLAALAFLVGVLACVGQVYYYGRYIYGDIGSLFGGVDPIGSGQLVRVQLSGKPEDIEVLQGMGIPIARPGLTDAVMLIDETETHYLIGIPHQIGHRAVKVVKEMVRAILYLN